MMGGLIRMMGTIIGVIIWILSVCLTCYLAKRKGRNIALWVVLSVFFSWIALIIIICLKSKRVIIEDPMSAEKKLERSGFRATNKEGGARCFVCDHHWGADGNVCNLYGIKFGDDFSSNDYVCNQCVTGMFDEHVEEWKRVLENKETGQ